MIKVNRGKLVPPTPGQAPGQPTVPQCGHAIVVSVGNQNICSACKAVLPSTVTVS